MNRMACADFRAANQFDITDSFGFLFLRIGSKMIHSAKYCSFLNRQRIRTRQENKYSVRFILQIQFVR